MKKDTTKPKLKKVKAEKQPKIDDKKGLFYDKKALNSDKERLLKYFLSKITKKGKEKN